MNRTIFKHAGLVVSFLIVSLLCRAEPSTVFPVGETVSKAGVVDADDPCIWIHPDNPAMSVVIGTDKKKGLSVYSLGGDELHHYPAGQINNIDIRYNIPVGGQHFDIVAGSNRTDNTISVFRVDPKTRGLIDIAAGPIKAGIDVYGFCLYRSHESGTLHGFVTSELGPVEQWELKDNGFGKIEGTLVRRMDFSSKCEGCVADDEAGYFYISEEAKGIWRLPAERNESGDLRVRIAEAGKGFEADVEGLAIYHGSGGARYLIASSQGDNSYSVFDLQAQAAYKGSFRIGAADGIDDVEHTDGIDVINVPLGRTFPFGLFVAHDGQNLDGDLTNFKYVPWERIAKSFNPPLMMKSEWSPRSFANRDHQ